MALAVESSIDEVPQVRLLNAVLGTLHKTALMADLIGQKDDSTTSILHAMLKAAFVFVANKEDRAKLDNDDVVGQLGRKLHENQRKLGTLNDVLLSAVGEALHLAAVKWPRGDPKSTSYTGNASTQSDNPSIGGNLGEVIDHPIDNADEEKAIPFPPPTDFPPEAEEQEREVVPMDDDDAMEEEESWRRNLIHDSLQRPLKEENYEKVDFDRSIDGHSKGDEGEEEHEPSSEGEDEESERTVQSEVDPPCLKKGAQKKINNSKRWNKPVKGQRFQRLTTLPETAKISLAVLKPSHYEYDGEASYTVGKFKCTLCGRRFIQASYLINHVNSHTGDKPFQCTVCKKRFGSHSGLFCHKRSSCKDAAASKLEKDHGQKKGAEKR